MSPFLQIAVSVVFGPNPFYKIIINASNINVNFMAAVQNREKTIQTSYTSRLFRLVVSGQAEAQSDEIGCEVVRPAGRTKRKKSP